MFLSSHAYAGVILWFRRWSLVKRGGLFCINRDPLVDLLGREFHLLGAQVFDTSKLPSTLLGPFLAYSVLLFSIHVGGRR